MNKYIYIEFIDAQKEKSAQLDWPVHYKYRAPVSLLHTLGIEEPVVHTTVGSFVRRSMRKVVR
jgi:hypothetical protein